MSKEFREELKEKVFPQKVQFIEPISPKEKLKNSKTLDDFINV